MKFLFLIHLKGQQAIQRGRGRVSEAEIPKRIGREGERERKRRGKREEIKRNDSLGWRQRRNGDMQRNWHAWERLTWPCCDCSLNCKWFRLKHSTWKAFHPKLKKRTQHLWLTFFTKIYIEVRSTKLPHAEKTWWPPPGFQSARFFLRFAPCPRCDCRNHCTDNPPKSP